MTWMQQVFGPSLDAGRATLILLGSYVVGCLTTGYYLVRLKMGMDIREIGSGSVGARNAGRLLGAPGFLATLIGDFAKGAAVVWLTRRFTGDDRLAAIAMLATTFGHIWPLQLGFRGGKGVATSLGALAVFDFRLGLLFVALTALLTLFGKMTPAGLIAFALLPLAARMLDRNPAEILTICVLAMLILLAHRKNILEEFSHLASPREEESKPDESLK